MFIYTYTYIVLVVCLVKMVSLSNDAYAILSGLKRQEESFSKVVVRLANPESPKKSILDCFGTWGTEGGGKETQRIIDEVYARRYSHKPRKLNW